MKTIKSKSEERSSSSSPSSFFNKKQSNPFFGKNKTVNKPFFSLPNIQTKLSIGSSNDKYEKEADAMAEQVVNHSPTSSLIQRKCENCEEEETIQRQEKEEEETLQMKSSETPTPKINEATSYLSSELNSSKGGGSPLSITTNYEMSQAFGNDFSQVKIHTGSQAIQMNQGLNARAFTHGTDVYFNQNEYNPSSKDGKKLLAHELTHVVQQKGSGLKSIQKKDEVCDSYDEELTMAAIDTSLANLKTLNTDFELELIRNIKWVIRCGSKESIKSLSKKVRISKKGIKIWRAANSAFGGYRGIYAGYDKTAHYRMRNLGVTETEGYDAAKRTEDLVKTKEEIIENNAAERTHLARADILYFTGHQYAQYSSPGVFANDSQTQFINLAAVAGQFHNVKLLISTSCAIICKEALEVFNRLFPNAVILGYRKTAPGNGSAARYLFERNIKRLKRPLFLDQPIDVEAIIDQWKAAVAALHPKDNTRYPGYFQNGMVHYLEMGKWKSVAKDDALNDCKKKGSDISEALH